MLRAAAEQVLVSAIMRLPPRWQRALAGGAPAPIDGNVLDAQTQLGLALYRHSGRPRLYTLDPERARRQLAEASRAFGIARRPMAEVLDLDAGAVLARLYRPLGLPARPPLIVYFHGGGGVLGSVDMYDRLCRALGDEARCAVLSVEYRLAPEHPFPAGVDDAFSAYRWATEHAAGIGVDGARIAVGGDSMGGNFAAAVGQAAIAGSVPPPRYQILLYPLLDLSRSSPSYRTFAAGYFLDRELLDWFVDNYIEHERDLEDWRNRLDRIEEPGGLAPALIVTAGFDPLRDEGRAYAERLRAGGAQVELLEYPSLIHGFLSTAGPIDAGRRALAEIGRAIRTALL